jgi:hypothetical protein
MVVFVLVRWTSIEFYRTAVAAQATPRFNPKNLNRRDAESAEKSKTANTA